MDLDEFDSWVGHKVRVRAVTPDDLDAFLADGRDKQAERLNNEVMPPQSPLHLEARLKEVPKYDNDNCWLAIEMRDGQLVGSLNAHETNQRHRNFYYGISVFRSERRKGYASEAVALLLRHYFRELGYHYVVADVYAFNAPSIAFHERMGFKLEGRLRESLFTRGQYHDELLFGMLASEFDALEARLPPLPQGYI